MLAFVAFHEELSKLGDDLGVELQISVRWVLQIFQEMLELLKSLLAKFIDCGIVLRLDYSKEFREEAGHALYHID